MFPCLFDLEKRRIEKCTACTLFTLYFMFSYTRGGFLGPWDSTHWFFVYFHSTILWFLCWGYVHFETFKIEHLSIRPTGFILLLFDRFQELGKILDIQFSQISNIRSMWTKKSYVWVVRFLNKLSALRSKCAGPFLIGARGSTTIIYSSTTTLRHNRIYSL